VLDFKAAFVGLLYRAIVVALCPRRIVGDRRGASGTLALQSVEQITRLLITPTNSLLMWMKTPRVVKILVSVISPYSCGGKPVGANLRF
jgi:hypothetical protein